MAGPTAVLLTAYLCLLGPGQAWLPARARRPTQLLAQIALSTAWTSTVGLALAAFGAFSSTRILAIGAVVTLLGFGVRLARHGPPAPRRPALDACMGPAVALVAVLVYWPPYETHLAGTDSTAYVSAGIQLAQTGALARRDPLTLDFPMPLRRVLFEPALGRPGRPPFVRQPGGMSLATLDATVATPNFFPVPMVWAALSSDALGARHAGAYAPAFCGLSLWAVAVFVRRRLGFAAALATAAVVGLNVAGYWAGRFALSEPLTAFLLWSGLVTLDEWEERSPAADPEHPASPDAAVAGLLLGATGLVRLDYTLFLAIALAIRHLLADAIGARRLPASFYLGFAAATMLTAAEIALIPGGYSLPITNALGGAAYRIELLWKSAPGLAVLLAGGGAGALAIGARRFGFGRTVMGAAVLTFLLGYTWVSSQQQIALSWSWLQACLGLPALLLAAVGAGALWKTRADHPGNAFLLVLCVLVGSLLLYDPHVQPIMLWGLRRFVPLVIPALIVAAAACAATIHTRSRALGAAAAVVVAASALTPARGLWSESLYRGGYDQVAGLEALLPDDAVLLIDRPLASYMLGTGLWLIHDRDCIPVDTTTEPGRAALTGLALRLNRRSRRAFLVQPATAVPPELEPLGTKPIAIYGFELLFPDHPAVDAPLGTRLYSMSVAVTELVPRHARAPSAR